MKISINQLSIAIEQLAKSLSGEKLHDSAIVLSGAGDALR